MLQIGVLSAFIGLVVVFIGQGWLTVLAFKKHILWGLLTLFVPFIYPFFDWKKAAVASYVTIAGVVVATVGMLIVWYNPEFQAQLQQAMDAVNQQ